MPMALRKQSQHLPGQTINIRQHSSSEPATAMTIIAQIGNSSSSIVGSGGGGGAGSIGTTTELMTADANTVVPTLAELSRAFVRLAKVAGGRAANSEFADAVGIG